MNYVLQGVGIAVGIALWPVALPAIAIALIVACARGTAAKRKSEPKPMPEITCAPGTADVITPEVIAAPRTYAGPQLPVLPKTWKAQQMAIVNERNRRFFENNYRK